MSDKPGTLNEDDEALLYSIIWNLISVADTTKLGVGLQDWVETFTDEVEQDNEFDYALQLSEYSNDRLDHTVAKHKGQIH